MRTRLLASPATSEELHPENVHVEFFCNSCPEFNETNDLSSLVFLRIPGERFVLPGDLRHGAPHHRVSAQPSHRNSGGTAPCTRPSSVPVSAMPSRGPKHDPAAKMPSLEIARDLLPPTLPRGRCPINP